MGFSSLPLYNIDPPNWQQHPNQQVLQGSGSGGNNHDQNQHLILPPPPLSHPAGQPQVGMGGGVGGGPGGPAIRPNSMSERARAAKILPPENQLPCPRCDSTNTKFCYYNNYSLTQPRHFCKTCRRYWTNGGALRNVPVGGGCRRNKRSSSKSSSGGGGGGGGGGGSTSSFKPSLTTTTLVGGNRIPLHMELVSTSGLIPTIPSAGGGTGMSSLMTSLQNMAQLGMGNLGLNFGGALNHPLGGLGGLTSGTHGGGGGGGGTGGGDHHLDFSQLNPSSTNPQVQFPNFLGGFEITGSSNGAGMYTSPFQNQHGIGSDENEQGNNSLPKNCSPDMNSQFAPIKTENNNNNNNETGNQFWAGNIGNNTTGAATSMWTNLSGLNSSSTSHLL